MDFDRRLSNTGHRLLCCLCAHLYNTPHADLDEFELPYHIAQKWTHLVHRETAVGYIKELIKLGFLIRTGLKGCPARALYRMPIAVLVKEAEVHPKPIAGHPRKPCKSKGQTKYE